MLQGLEFWSKAGWGALGSGDDSEGLLPAAESVLPY